MSSEFGVRSEIKTPNSGLNTPNFRFIADAMLGRLARWLRLLGFDTLYYKDISDAEVLKIAKQQNRIVLTRDTHFLNFRNFKDFLLISSNSTMEQLVEMAAVFHLKSDVSPRCSKCNGILSGDVEKESVRGLVPEYVYLRFKRFLKCGDCGGIYWEGSHAKRFKEKF
ncbi:MAG: Mut7-C RNAse domain-containing protein [Thermodesulfovibrionales bacterium]|nr:Mut7-C RNAse domain-containing protein [Thermodesulfovibrionales bacterium]